MKILIADNLSIVRIGVRSALADIYPHAIIEEVDNETRLVDKVLKESWTIIITNVVLTGRGGIEMIKNIKRSVPKTPVIVMSLYANEDYGVRSILAGASAFLGGKSSFEELLVAVERVLTGKRYITTEIAEQLLELINDSSNKLPHKTLSNREFEVMKLMIKGQTVSEISKKMSLSSSAISYNKAKLFKKMNFGSTSELLKYALQQNLI